MAEPRCEILTGRFETGTGEQKRVIRKALGGDAPARYELYFHWYNVVHELAHLIVQFNAAERLHGVEEERYVNDFAVAYWSLYGEAGKLTELESIVTHGLGQFVQPAPAGVGHMEFFREHWGDGAYYNFNDYGWFQFSCVSESLGKREPLESVIRRRFGERAPYAHSRIPYDLWEGNVSQKIIDDAREILQGWGLAVPPVAVRFIDNPDDHRININWPEEH